MADCRGLASFTVVMRSCFYFQVEKLTDPCAALQQPLYGIALFAMASLEQHALVPPPSPPTTGNCPQVTRPCETSHPWYGF
jgi:hypothetical protein